VDAARALVSAEAFDTGVWLEFLRAGAPAARTALEALAGLQRTVDAAAMAPDRAEQTAAQIQGARFESMVLLVRALGGGF
jgi:hypothetical protein